MAEQPNPYPINTKETLRLAKEYVHSYVDPVIVSAAATLTNAQTAQGVILHNTGASGATVFVSPTPQPGDRLTAVVRAAQALTIDLPTGTVIDGVATSGQTYTADAIGEFLVLVCVVEGAWSRISTGGTWTAA